MPQLLRTGTFDAWLAGLKDERAKARIAVRMQRLAHGNPGDAKPVGNGVVEMRVDYGPGYRVYYAQRGRELVILLCGGDKGSQANDIQRAKAMAATL